MFSKKKIHAIIQSALDENLTEKFFSLPEKNLVTYKEEVLSKLKVEPKTGASYIYLKGQKSMPLLYLVHGMGATVHFFFEGVLFLNSLGFSVFSHARLGDESKVPEEDLTVENFVNEMEYVLKKFGHKKFHILSSSFGVVLSLLLAERHQHWVKSITSICGFLNFPWNMGLEIARKVFRKSEIEFLSMKALGPLAPQVKYIKLRSPDVLDFVLEQYGTIPFKNFLGACVSLKNLHYENTPPKVNVPMYLIHGAEDMVIPSRQFVNLCNAYPHAQNELMFETGHGPFLSRPVELYKNYLTFLLGYYS